MIKKIIYTNNCADVPICLNSKGGRNGVDGLQPSLQNRIYSSNGSSVAITTSHHPSYIVKSKNNLKLKLNIESKQLIETIEQNELPIGKVKHLDLYNRNVTKNCGALSDPSHNNNRLWDGLRIRKLTPKECWRLMGFADESFDKAEKVNSNAQLYKQAGNSIVVNVLMNIFKQLL